MLVFAPNLPWPSVNLRRLLESTIDLPVVLENAASACALAELWFGRHPDNVRDLIAVTVSEGVGVGLLLNAQLFHGTGSLAGELGHVTLDDEGPRCSCGKRGCWEQYASNAAALARYNAASTDTGRRSSARPSARPLQAFADLLRLAETGDTRAGETLDSMARYLAIGLAPIVTALAPQVVVIVGEITAAWNRVGPVIEDVIRSRSMSLIKTRIVPTDPATQPRLRGAVTLVVQQHFGLGNVA